MDDRAYSTLPPGHTELTHHYGSQVHLLASSVLLTELAQLCEPSCRQPRIISLVRSLYRSMARHVIAQTWPTELTTCATRMAQSHKEGHWRGPILSSKQKAIIVDIARAGTVPAQTCFEQLIHLLDPDAVRQDHLAMARVTDAQGRVTHADLSGSKIGGKVADRLVWIPDPMGATGTSMVRTVDLYKTIDPKPPKKLVALHLIVTPEYLATMHKHHPDVIVWALRLDRGLSPAHVLMTEPGTHWAEERGLNDRHYIIPGAGGIGELLNNADV